MSQIQTSDQARKLQRGLRLTSLPDSILAPEIVGVIILEDYSKPLIGTEFGCSAGTTRGAVAAEFSQVILRRPNAQIRVKVLRVFIGASSAQAILISIPNTPPGGFTELASRVFNDLEVPGRPSAFFGSDTAIAIPARRDMYSIRVPADQSIVVTLDIDLGAPGVGNGDTDVLFANTVVNTSLSVGLEWVEGPTLG